MNVEYLLFECLQDITGGEILFGVGINSLMVDIMTIENRTNRIAGLDTFFLLGLAVGLQLSGIIRNYFGWVALFIISSTVLVISIFYMLFGKLKKARTLKTNFIKMKRLRMNSLKVQKTMTISSFLAIVFKTNSNLCFR